MKVKIKSFGHIRSIMKSPVVTVTVKDNATAKDVIDAFINDFPEVKKLLFHDGKIHSYYTLVDNDNNDIENDKLEKKRVSENDLIKIIPFIGGG